MLNNLVVQFVVIAAVWTTLEASSGDDFWSSESRSTDKCLLRVPCVSVRDDYKNVPGIGAYKVHTHPSDWNTGRKICEQEGAHLAVINSVTEANAIARIFKNASAIVGTDQPKYAAIGFHDLYKNNEFVTIFSQSLEKAGYDEFDENEPNNLNNAEHCGSITKNGKLNDINCHIPLGFICELETCSYDDDDI